MMVVDDGLWIDDGCEDNDRGRSMEGRRSMEGQILAAETAGNYVGSLRLTTIPKRNLMLVHR